MSEPKVIVSLTSHDLRLKNEISEIPDDEISKDDRARIESLINEILEKKSD